MSDPLSVAASIAGLISLAGQLYSVLDNFITSIKDAPSLARTVHAEINAWRHSLLALQKLLSSPAFRPARAALTPAEHVIISFTDAVLLFSELEATVLPLAATTRTTSFTARTRWARKGPKLNILVARLQWHKGTLILQLSILQCGSDADAQRDRVALHKTVTQKLKKDAQLERRLALVEHQLLHSGSQSTFDRGSILSEGNDSDNLTIVPDSQDGQSRSFSDSWANINRRSFEESLILSRVYRRVEHHEEDMSFRSSIAGQSAWSRLSDISLGDLSVLSVIALPISVGELYNRQWYETQPTLDSRISDSSGVGVPTIEEVAVVEIAPTRGQVEAEPTSTPSAFASGVTEGMSLLSVNLADDFAWSDSLKARFKPAEQCFDTPMVLGGKEVSSSRDSRYKQSAAPLANGDTRAENDREKVGVETTDQTHEQRGPLGPAVGTAFSPVAPDSREIGDAKGSEVTAPLPGSADSEEDTIYSCKGCGEILEEGKAYEINRNRWHIECFKCVTCGILLDHDAKLLMLADGSLVCNNCTYSCNACGNKIEDLAILTGDEAFCAGCFRCRNCKRKIENLRHARTSRGIFCMSCHDALMARRRIRHQDCGVELEFIARRSGASRVFCAGCTKCQVCDERIEFSSRARISRNGVMACITCYGSMAADLFP